MKALADIIQFCRYHAEDLCDTFRVYFAFPLAMLLVVLVTVVAVAFIYLWRARWIVLAAGLLALGVYTLDGFMLLGT